MNPWILVGAVVATTALGDLLQSFEMKRHGEIDDFRPSGIGRLLVTLARKKYLILAVFFMAISFFAFMTLLSAADLSFAVPATALSMVLETILARIVLKERVDRWRWAGAALVAAGVALLAV
ncbi:MAG: EamA family transporter [Bryobacteraceae bacterium]